ncbi:MAG TPA: SulP family inorganic anion transporter, partial [Saprospiraceae bacterium]|nr:SulP family inorganic anion transporter [Saprospiraceae bacterium]
MQQNSLRIKDTMPQDLLGGIAVFLVALPLCLGIALASGAPLFSGIIAGIVGGIVIGFFSQSPLSVSGPAAGLSTIVLSSIQQLGEFSTFLMSVMLAGIFQIIFGVLRLGRIADYIPSAVIRGMLAAIGLTLILKQLPHAVGYDKDYEGDESFLQDDGHNTLSELFYSTIGPLSFSAIFICLASIAILVIFQSNIIKSNRYLKFVPGPLVVVVFGIVANQMISNFIGIEAGLSEDHLVKIPVSADFTSFLNQFSLPDFN